MVLECSGWGCRPADPALAVRTICQDCHRGYCAPCLAGRGRLFRRPRCPHCAGGLVDSARPAELRDRPKTRAVLLHEAGIRLAGRGEFAAALVEFERAVRWRPKYVAAHFHRGLVLRELGRYPEVVAALEQTVRLDPRHAQALYDLAGAHRRAEALTRAVQCYDRALLIQPRYLAALVNKAVTLNELDQPVAALVCCERALALAAAGLAADRTPHLRSFVHGAKGAALLRLGRAEEALAALDTAIGDGPEAPEDNYNRARALAQLGRLAEAERAYRAAEELGDRR